MVNYEDKNQYKVEVDSIKLNNNSNYMFKNYDIVTVNSEAILSKDVKENLDRIGNVEFYIFKDISTPDVRYLAGRKIKDNGEICDFITDKDECLLKFYKTDLKLIEHNKLNYVPDITHVLVRNMYVSNFKPQDGYKIGKVVIESKYNKGSKILYNTSDVISIVIDGITYYQVALKDVKGLIS